MHSICCTLTNAIYVFLRIVVMHRAAGSACGSNWITRATVYGCTMIIMTNTAVTLLCYYSLPSQTVVQATHSPLPARYCIYNFGRAQIHVDACTRTYTYDPFHAIVPMFLRKWRSPRETRSMPVKEKVRQICNRPSVFDGKFTICTKSSTAVHLSHFAPWFNALIMMRVIIRILCHKVWHGFNGMLFINFTVSFISMITEREYPLPSKESPDIFPLYVKKNF